jgi:hypothetical protein
LQVSAAAARLTLRTFIGLGLSPAEEAHDSERTIPWVTLFATAALGQSISNGTDRATSSETTDTEIRTLP